MKKINLKKMLKEHGKTIAITGVGVVTAAGVAYAIKKGAFKTECSSIIGAPVTPRSIDITIPESLKGGLTKLWENDGRIYGVFEPTTLDKVPDVFNKLTDLGITNTADIGVMFNTPKL